MDIDIAPVIDQQGNLAHRVVMPKDNGQGLWVKDQLHLFQSVTEVSTDSVIITELAGEAKLEPVIVYINPAFTRLTGYSAEEAIGQSVRILHKTNVGPNIIEQIHAALANTAPAAFETVNDRKDGSEFWAQWSITAIPSNNGSVGKLLIVLRETSEQHYMEDELHRQRDFNDKIVQSSLSFFVTISADGQIMTANPALLNALGYTLDEIVGRNAVSDEFVASEDLLQLGEIGGVLRRSKQPVSFETYLRTKLRGDILVGWRAVPVAREDDQIDFIFLTGADIGAKKQAEEAKRQAEILLRQSNILLEERVKERTRELSKLLETSRIVSSAADLTPLLKVILDQLKDVINFTSAGILTYGGSDTTDLKLIAGNGLLDSDSGSQWNGLLVDSQFVQSIILDMRTQIIPDVHADSDIAKNFRDRHIQMMGSTLSNIVQSWMGVPLVIRDRAIGLLVMQSSQLDHFNTAKADLALTFANQVAIAIENARLFEAESERRQEAERRRIVAEGLSDIVDRLNSNRTLDETLDFILGQALQLLGGSGAVLFQLNHSQQLFRVQVFRQMPQAYADETMVRLGEGVVSMAVMTRMPHTTNNLQELLQTDGRASDERRIKWANWLNNNYAGLLAVPIIVKDQPYGVFALYYKEPRAFTQEDLDLALVIASQAALAIENAQLRTKSAQAAALAERSRLARELHDSVSQALFGMSLGTRTSLELLNKDPARAKDPMDYVLSLAEAALAEMRALIFELRPESLETEGLHAAFKKQAARLVARQKIHVQTELLGDEQGISLEAKEALYRIGMEAIQNTIKHARATEVTLVFNRAEDRSVLLEIRDNGMGFDPSGAFPGHLGLKTMRERAEEQDGSLEISSTPGGGTCVRVHLPVPGPRV